MIGISIKPTIGVGDALQFSSLPENYYRATKKRLVDVNRPWFFDYNPYVDRDPNSVPTKTYELWNFSPTQRQWPKPRTDDKPAVYLSNAEIHASIFEVPVVLNRPRLYQHENFPFDSRHLILLHTDGVSHGKMPPHIVQHVVNKYRPTGNLFRVGLSGEEIGGVPWLKAESLWELAAVISKARLFIGVDSGPGWIASCFPDVITKIVRMKPSPETFASWVPLEIRNIHSHWDDRCRQAFNPTEDDVGFTSSYRKL